jgi:hypothetical protein
VIKAGTILYVSSGSYSSYVCYGVFVAAKEIPDDIQQQYGKEWHRQSAERQYSQIIGFPAWLLDAGYVVELDADELWGGDY